jgi:hypothetical protein
MGKAKKIAKSDIISMCCGGHSFRHLPLINPERSIRGCPPRRDPPRMPGGHPLVEIPAVIPVRMFCQNCRRRGTTQPSLVSLAFRAMATVVPPTAIDLAIVPSRKAIEIIDLFDLGSFGQNEAYQIAPSHRREFPRRHRALRLDVAKLPQSGKSAICNLRR